MSMSGRRKTGIAILASGSGSTAEAFIHASQAGIVNAEVGLVIANNADAGVFSRVARLNKEYGLNIKTVNISGVTHSKGAGEKGEQTLEESTAICEEINRGGFGLVLLLGYMKKVRGDLLNEFGALPSHKSIHQARMINTHPGPLPQTKGLFGVHAQEVVLETGLGYSAQTLHVVAEDYDSGLIIAEHRVPVLPNDTPESLFESVQLTEKTYLPIDIDNFLKQRI